MARLSHVANAMADDDLAPQEAKPSSAMTLTYLTYFGISARVVKCTPLSKPSGQYNIVIEVLPGFIDRKMSYLRKYQREFFFSSDFTINSSVGTNKSVDKTSYSAPLK